MNGVPFASTRASHSHQTTGVLAVIPARLGSTRLPRKPLRLLAGAPLIVRVWEQVRETATVEHVVVATDSEEVAAVIRERGGEAILTNPRHPSGTDRVAEVAGRDAFQAYDIIVNVQGDEPFIRPEAIAGPVSLVREGHVPVATCATPAAPAILENSDVVKVVSDDAGRALYFSRAPIPFLRDREDASVHSRLVRQHVGVYACSRPALSRWVSLPEHPLERSERLEQLRPLAAGLTIGVFLLEVPPLGGIDTEEDLKRANTLWDDFYAGRP